MSARDWAICLSLYRSAWTAYPRSNSTSAALKHPVSCRVGLMTAKTEDIQRTS